MNKLLEEFNNMEKLHVIEINWRYYDEDLNEDTFEYFNITADSGGLYADDINSVFVEWDDYCDLDWHIVELYDRLIEDYMSKTNLFGDERKLIKG